MSVGLPVLGLATYRLSRIIPVDDVAEPVRQRLHAWALEGDSEYRARREWLEKLLTCTDCSGFWIGVLLGLFAARGGPRRRILTGIAAAGASSLAGRLTGALERVD